ncbi:hypothetical protein [Brevundimonas sp.]|uniref:hypothetical protein n=1 Tax=Brevundimonas sp. TaxID=1871086 RepID=UPI002D4D9893|nr:hypothetical protein [Brevundimonas sp.]HYC68832.1 hypothetical protein [Brevundimonas sp.]
MSQFEYFFGFYSLVLGLSVVELLTGVARAIENRSSLKLSRLTLMLALFLALDLSSYWLQAWQLYRGAPLSMSVFTHGLVAAGTYFIAAYLIFPRITKLKRGEGLNDHFWATRRWVFGAVLLINVLNVGTIAVLTGGFAFIGGAGYTAFIATFYVTCAVAAVAPRGRLVILALIWLLIFSMLALLMDAIAVADAGWRVGG